MKKLGLIFLITALLVGFSACAAKKPYSENAPQKDGPAARVLTDRSVFELYFEAEEAESVWKSVTQKPDGTPIKKQLYQRCGGFTFRITGIYGTGDLDAAVASEFGYVDNLT